MGEEERIFHDVKTVLGNIKKKWGCRPKSKLVLHNHLTKNTLFGPPKQKTCDLAQELNEVWVS